MKWFNWLRNSTPANPTPATSWSSFRPDLEQFGAGAASGRSQLRSFKPEVEQLEQRLVMSHSGLITSATDWQGVNSLAAPVMHQYAIQQSTGAVQENTTQGNNVFNYTGWVTLPTSNDPGRVYQISASLDQNYRAECFAITSKGVWVYQESQKNWRNLGAPMAMQQISAAHEGTVYALSTSGTIWQDTVSGGWQQFTSGPKYAYQISAGQTATTGNEVLWVIDTNHNVQSFGWSGISSWMNWGGYVTQISGTVHDSVYAIGGSNAIYYLSADWYSWATGTQWHFTGGYGSAIDAGTDNSGLDDRVFLISLGPDHSIYEYSQSGPQAGWAYDGGSAREIAATDYSPRTPQEAGSVMLIGSEGAAHLYTNWSIYGYNPYAGLRVNEGGYWL